MAEKKKKSMFKTYDQAKQTRSLEKANKEANKLYRDKIAASKQPQAKYTPTDTSIGPNLTSKSNRQYGSVDRNVQDYQGAKAPDYSVSKESATGTLSAKTETSSNDRMSWAREAERKARRLMGGR